MSLIINGEEQWQLDPYIAGRLVAEGFTNDQIDCILSIFLDVCKDCWGPSPCSCENDE